MDKNQQAELEASNPEYEKLALLEDQLREAVAGEEFFNLASGKLFNKLIAKEISILMAELTSEKFIKNHQGYLECLGRLRQARRMLRLMQIAADPSRKAKIQEKKDALNE